MRGVDSGVLGELEKIRVWCRFLIIHNRSAYEK